MSESIGLRARLRLVLFLFWPYGAAPVLADIEPGKVDAYHEIDPGAPDSTEPVKIPADSFRELSLEDLRKITLYSRLGIRGSRVQIADTEHMRSVEPHPKDRNLLVVTSDHFRFTLPRTAQIDPKGLTREEQAYTRFLWIKHATREEAPDGKPWLKDLVLLPYNPRSGELLVRWPFHDAADTFFPGMTLPFLRLDPRPRWNDFPPAQKCVVGIFNSGRTSYLVLDVFGGFQWWGQVEVMEYFSLRGKNQAAIDAFHGGPREAKRRARAPFTFQQWQNPQVHLYHEIVGAGGDDINRLRKDLPAILQTPVRSEKTEGYEDLLRLGEDGRPVKAIDDMVTGLETFGDLLRWAVDYSQSRTKGDLFWHWYRPLDELVGSGSTDQDGYIVAIRTLRYAFRRMGFPARIHGCRFNPGAWYPGVALHAYLPSRAVSFVVFPAGRVSIFPSTGAQFWALPTVQATRQGKIPVFDCNMGTTRGLRWTPRKDM